jgi:lipopolysaccharide transport system ATP-binding protein
MWDRPTFHFFVEAGLSDLAIRADLLGKQYRIGIRAPYQTLRERITRLGAGAFRPFGRRRTPTVGGTGDGRFWALKEVSFEVRRGDVVGIIGRNGAGKSTLLKILARVTEPTTGEADLWGRVGSLLEVGTGFHPELTGRENVYLNGAILGMKRAEIARKFDEIVAFAEVEQFIDTPVKFYSSGMYMRLAFSVAAHLEPEILIVDEVLAVGDAAFQQKCLGRMGEIARQGRTVLFVSHNMAAVNRLCTYAYWLDSGRIRDHGRAADVVSDYLSLDHSGDNGEVRWADGIANPGETAFAFLAVQLQRMDGSATTQFFCNEPIMIRMSFRIASPLFGARVGFYVTSTDGATILEAYDSDQLDRRGERVPGTYVVSARIPECLLNEGSYQVGLNAGVPGLRNLCHLENVLWLRMDNPNGAGAFLGEKRAGCIFPNLGWQAEDIH